MKPLLRRAQVICACFFLFLAKTNAQAPDTSTVDKLLHYILQPLDKTQVPTAFLEEWGAPIIPMATFSGTLSDSNKIDMNLWRTLYFQQHTGYCGTGFNPLASITNVNSTISQNSYDSLPVPIPIFIGQYNSVKSYAFTNNLLSYHSSTNQVFDVPGRPENPYQLNNLFAACPDKQINYTGSATFICKSNLIWNSTNKTISQIQIDFANSMGFRNITINTPISVSYADTGTKRWTIKITFTDNTVFQCYSDYKVLRAGSNNSRYNRDFIDNTWFIPATGAHPGATVSIRYSRLGTTFTLRKPLLVVEGYDVSDMGLQDNYAYRDVVDAIDASLPTYDFNANLDEVAGYDLLFVDFDEGTGDIPRNAALVEDIIANWVNLAKVPDNRFGNIMQQNVVMGISMGGLVARYALAEMTKNNVNTQTRLLITHDSPHHGANVPLGLQYLIRMAGQVQLFGTNITDVFPQYNDAIGLLNRPATQQLLLYRATGTNSVSFNTFLDGVYRTMITFAPADPQPAYRFIATSLGSECAHQVYQPYTKLLDADADVFLFFFPLLSLKIRATIESWALPMQGSTNKIAHLKLKTKWKLFALITISKDVYDNSAYAPGGQLPVDGAPGGLSPFATESFPQFNFAFPWPGLLGLWGYVSAHLSGTPTVFTFVPTASALDVTPFNYGSFLAQYVNGVSQFYPSTAETFIAQETNGSLTNNVHPVFTARNAHWLYNEMESLNNNLNCSAECFNNYYIVGNDALCTTGNYFIPGLQRGATVTWGVSNAGIANQSCVTCNPVTLTRVSTGTITLTATIQNACGGQPIVLQKTITTGLPFIGGTYLTNGQEQPIHIWFGNPATDYNNACNLQLTNTNMQVTGASSVTWSKITSSPSNISWSQNGNNISFYFWGIGQTAVFRITASNACGNSTYDFGFKSVDCSGGGGGGGCDRYTISPNPAISVLNVNRVLIPPPCRTALAIPDNENPVISEIKVYDLSGNLKIVQRFAGSKSVSLDVSRLKPGSYFVDVSDGKNTERKQVLIVK